MTVCENEEKELLAARSYLDSVEYTIKRLREEIRAIAPSLSQALDDAEAERGLAKKRAETARQNFAAAVVAQVKEEDDFGKGKLHPHVTVKSVTTVVPDMTLADHIARWLLDRGMGESISFKFNPIAYFKHLKAADIPQVNDKPIFRVEQTAEAAVDSHDKWTSLSVTEVHETLIVRVPSRISNGEAGDDVPF